MEEYRELESNAGNTLERGNEEGDAKTADKKKNVMLVSTAISLSFLVAVFAPLEFYFSNISDLWYDIYNLLPILVTVFVLLFVVLWGIGKIISKKEIAGQIYCFALMIFSICAYVQGTFVLVPYGEFGGENIQWEKYSMYNVSSIAIWMGIIAIGIVAFYMTKKEKHNSIVTIIMVCLFLTQFISVTVVGVDSEGFQYKERMRTVTENKWNYSKNKNFFVFIVDTLDSRVLSDYLQQGMETGVNKTFENFTLYRDTLGAFNLTNYAVPYIMTGEYYYNDMAYQDYIEEAYDSSPLLKRLDDEGWITRLHTSQSMPEETGKEYIDNLKHVRLEVKNYIDFSKAIYNLVLFKYAPTPVKKYVYYDAERLELLYYVKRIEDTDLSQYDEVAWDSGLDDWNNNNFFWNISRIETSEDEKVFNMYHMKGLHSLRDIDGNIQVIEDPDEAYSLAGETGVVLYILYSWIEEIKEQGIYDDSIIVIMGDHGASAYADPQNFTQCPVLAIKGAGEKHQFNVSEIPVSYDDLQDIFGALLDGYTGTDVMKQALELDGINIDDYELYSAKELAERFVMREVTTEKVGRQRKFIFHKFTGNLQGKGRGGPGYELYTDYPAYDGSKIQSTGVIYKP